MKRRDFKVRRGWRRVAFFIHFGLGLVLGLWLVSVSLTGSLIVFRDEIENALHPSLVRIPAGGPSDHRVALQPILDTVRTLHPGATFHTLNLPVEPDRSLSFWGHDGDGRSFHVFANPFTGEVLGVDHADDNLTEWLYLFHAQLLGGGTGERINGLGSIAWVLLLLSGLALWVPRKGRPWREGLLVRWHARPRRQTHDVHRAVGFWSALPLLLVVVTGAYFPFKKPFRWLAESLTATSASEDSPHPSPRTDDSPVVSLDVVLATTASVLPESPANWIHLPRDAGDVFTVRKRLPGEWRMEGANHLHVDPATGHLLRADLHRERTPAQRLLRSLFPLHAGTFGGLLTRILWVLLGCVPAVLFVSGILMGWRHSWELSRRVPSS